MRVAIDAIPLLLRSAGVKTYLFHWIASLRRLAGDGSVAAFPSVGPLGDCSHERSVLGRLPTLGRLALLHANNYSPVQWLDWIGPKADVFHASQQLWNPPRRCRLTATLYDMTCWLVPGTHSRANVIAAHRFAGRVLRRADGLIAISENTRRDAVRILGLPPEKIEVIYPGVSDAFFHTTSESAAAAATTYGLERPYALFVGTIEPRKNVDRLIDAWAALAPGLRSEFDLVLAGPLGWAKPSTVARLQSPSKSVRYLGYVPEEDLPGLTRGASIFVYPSLYEGFGLPVGQAMAAGVPVVTSNVSSMPEVAGEAALLADPLSTPEVARAIETLLLSESLRTQLSSHGLRLAQRYRWEHCAAASWRFFERLCA
jgi:glycosyltransferase involved in cell wall biosynthesis